MRQGKNGEQEYGGIGSERGSRGVGTGARREGRRSELADGPDSTLLHWSYGKRFGQKLLRFAWQGAEFGRRDTAIGSRFIGRGYLQNNVFLARLRSKNE